MCLTTIEILNEIHKNNDVHSVSNANNEFGDDICDLLWRNGFIGSDGREIWLTDKAFDLLLEQELISKREK